MRKNSSEFVTSFASEAGTFRINKDYFAYAEMDDMACYITADGIDSDEDINSAELVVNFLFENLLKKPTMSRARLKKYIMEAHKLLNERSRSVRLKTSLMVVLTDYSKMIYASAGNTRLYHFRKGGMNFRSKDQSIAQIMADAGQITEEEIATHDERNNLTSYLGQSKVFKPFISRPYKLNDNDIIFISTAGFWENVQTIDLVNSLKDAKESEDFIEILEDELLSRQNKVVNNYTMVAIYANKVFKENIKDDLRMKIAKKAAKIAIPIVIALVGLLVFNTVQSSKAQKQVVDLEEKGDKNIEDESYEKALKNYEEASSSAEKVKKKETRDRIKLKTGITNLIVEGDNLLASSKYEDAKDIYIKARTQVEFELEEGKAKLIQNLDRKIDRTDDFITVYNKSLEGDEEVAEGDKIAAKAEETEDNGAKKRYLNEANGKYKDAIEIYTEAKSRSEEIKYYDMKKEMEDKIKDTEDKIKDADDKASEAGAAAAKNDKAKDLVKKAEDYKKSGDKKYNLKQYEEAKIDYQYGLDIYKELSDKYEQDTTEKRSEIERIILGIDKKIEEQKALENQQNSTPGVN